VPAVRTDAHAIGDGLSAEIALHVVNRKSESPAWGKQGFHWGKRMGDQNASEIRRPNSKKVHHWAAQAPDPRIGLAFIAFVWKQTRYGPEPVGSGRSGCSTGIHTYPWQLVFVWT
jgi:hypothetical protein